MQLQLGDMVIDVVQKDIKNVHLSVYPPTGKVRISAPLHMDLETIRIYAISRLGWIRKHQVRLQDQVRESPREYITRESHYYLGKRYLLKVLEKDDPPKVILRHNTIEIHVRPSTDTLKRQTILDEWYRQRLREIIADYLPQWESRINVVVKEIGIKKMKTKWGSCNREARRIWFNLELAKKSLPCIEYILVHEMVHLLERKHNDNFIRLMDTFMPRWRYYKEELNRSPLRHEKWGY